MLMWRLRHDVRVMSIASETVHETEGQHEQEHHHDWHHNLDDCSAGVHREACVLQQTVQRHNLQAIMVQAVMVQAITVQATIMVQAIMVQTSVAYLVQCLCIGHGALTLYMNMVLQHSQSHHCRLCQHSKFPRADR